MRLSISCDACRYVCTPKESPFRLDIDPFISRAKVKCVHNGSPPCHRCHKNKNEGCTLTDPRASNPRNRQNASGSGSRKRKLTLETSPRLGHLTPKRGNSRNTSVGHEDLIAALSPSTVINAVETYRKKFPVTNFLHYPSLISDISSNLQSVEPIFVASLLSLCVRFMNGSGLENEEVYAGYVQRNLMHRVMDAPSLYLAQSLVMISFYEWGTGRPYQAWMYSGKPSKRFPRRKLSLTF